ncbi:diacylglycerol/lipid kinase family protein [Aureimonas sp. AU40]|uniref:diacylglycerol/lipid kinase family protein n=1 Tax=Aureimonas sp. AU40 TaxID=1637747 RepID=UPI0007808261|nr:diacylglycerol kinase family protein [Aureimonas sp. AU40]
MKVHALLNRGGGTLRTLDLDILSALICDEFRMHGHEIEVDLLSGEELIGSIREHSERSDLDVLMVGGGDGTVSAAAAAVAHSPVALGVLPAGTMNLFARSLQIPLELEQAIRALSTGRIVEVDIASVNDEFFIHQFAVGLHARMVRTRDKIDYGSKVGKMWASVKAVVSAVRSLPLVDLEIEIDGKRESIRTPAVAISNNLYGDGHLPFADDPQAGRLGIYLMRSHDRAAMLKMTMDMMRGAWKANKDLTVTEADSIRIVYGGRKTHSRAVMDGELKNLDRVSDVTIHRRGLKVLVPESATID